jgi:preprotein translocase subunit Sss1
MASLEEKSDQFTRIAGQPDLFDYVDLAQISKISQNPRKLLRLEEKSDQFTRMAGQPDLFEYVDLAQVWIFSQNRGKSPV